MNIIYRYGRTVSMISMLIWSQLAGAEQSRDSQISVQESYVRETLPGTQMSSAYMRIDNHSDDMVTLKGASSDISPRIEIHEHSMNDGMMRMRQVDDIKINAHESVILQPSGLHLMIFDVEHALKNDENITIKLHFAKHPDVIVSMPVVSIKNRQ